MSIDIAIESWKRDPQGNTAGITIVVIDKRFYVRPEVALHLIRNIS